MRRFFEVAALAGLLAACNVSPAATTGGADLPSRGECPRGLALVSGDFSSSEVALLAPDGGVASASFMSSASGLASGTAAPLSGDLDVRASTTRANELVLVDRFGTNVLTFVDAATAAVRGQLAIGTGFMSNPQDYVELDEHRAYVPRLTENTTPGREPFDAGSDLLIVDPSQPEIVGSLPMPRQPGYLPNPVAVVRLGDVLLVTLQHARPDYSGMSDSELVAVAEESIRYRLPLVGLQNCGRAELSPSGALLVVACTSFIDRRGEAPNPNGSGIVWFDASQEPPRELGRWSGSELLGGPIQSSLELVTDELLLFKSQTALGAQADNQLFSLQLSTGKTELLATAARGVSGQGYGIAFGGMSCRAACGDPCLVTDASTGQILRFVHADDRLERGDDIALGGAGLPPLGLTPFW
ncbi:MAG TPA: hypothetical protein VEX18_10450 [Polyangiaceae bacterium]|nr:hypothetical protein [Polyangiaceae bacterium]